MPTVNLSPEADASAISSGEGAGAGSHLPIGYWSGYKFRSIVRFPIPAGWQNWSSITAATLTFYTSDFYHVGVRNSSIYIRPCAFASLWTKASGSQNCDSGYSSSNTTKYSDMAAASTAQVSFASGTAANSKKVVSVVGMVTAHWNSNTSKIEFIFDPVGTSDYSELWSLRAGSTYDMVLSITYVDQSPPNVPGIVAPAAGSTVDGTLTPTFQWTYSDPQNDPQVNAQVALYQNDGTTLINTYTVTGAATSVVGTDTLVRGTSYKWQVRTADAVSGYGAWSALQTFTIRANPVVTLSATRAMVYQPGQPRLVVSWTSDQPQASYRVTTASGYDSGVISGTGQTHTLTRNLVNGTAEAVTVAVTSTFGVTGSATQSFTPRWGLTTHRRDLGAAPVGWLVPTIVATVPAGATLQVEYGSDPAANAAPASGWFSDIAAVPVNRYLFWRAWFIPSATAGPTLDTITIPANLSVTLLDKWGTTRDVEVLAAPWSVDTGTAVYGTRSITVSPTGAATRCYAFAVKLRAGRSYILTGLMKATGNPGSCFQLEDAAGNLLQGGGFSLPTGPVRSPILAATIDWYTPTRNDTNRYRTPIYVAPSDMTAYVVLFANGAAGSKAWWDAIKLEESTVATPWSPGAIGATVIDAGGVQIDNTRGGVFRYKGSAGGARDVVEGGANGLQFGGDTQVASPATGVITVAGAAVRVGTQTVPVIRTYGVGASTWTKPAGLAFAVIEVIGGGAAGAGALSSSTPANGSRGGGGGSGGYSRRIVPAASLGATEAVTVGAGGTGASAGPGTVGGASSFGTWCTANGGGVSSVSPDSGAAWAGQTGGPGGAVGTGDLAVAGTPGGWGFGSGYLSTGGNGGNSVLGGGGQGGLSNSQPVTAPGLAATGPGGGGGGGTRGGSAAAVAGGAGAAGIVIVTEYYL